MLHKINLIILALVSLSLGFDEKNNLIAGSNGKLCCQVNMPLKPVFDSNGHLVDYVQQDCPQQYLVCCKAHIGLYGVCLRLDYASRWLKFNQDYANRFGIELNLAILENEQDWCCSHAQSNLDIFSKCTSYYWRCCTTRPNEVSKMDRNCLSLNFADTDYFEYYLENADEINQNAIQNFGK